MGPIGDDDLSGFYWRPQSLEPLQRQLRWPRRELKGPWHGKSFKGLEGGLGGPLTELEWSGWAGLQVIWEGFEFK